MQRTFVEFIAGEKLLAALPLELRRERRIRRMYGVITLLWMLLSAMLLMFFLGFVMAAMRQGDLQEPSASVALRIFVALRILGWRILGWPIAFTLLPLLMWYESDISAKVTMAETVVTRCHGLFRRRYAGPPTKIDISSGGSVRLCFADGRFCVLERVTIF
jgi:hypothetical protein